MPNANPTPRVPNATYIPLVDVGSAGAGVVSFGVGVGSRVGVGSSRLRVGSATLFGYQHVCISNTKLSGWGSRPMRDPNASCFALQWNIGFNVLKCDCDIVYECCHYLSKGKV